MSERGHLQENPNVKPDPRLQRRDQTRNASEPRAKNAYLHQRVASSGSSINGAKRSQPVATVRKRDSRENGSNKRKPLPPVATSCDHLCMVRRGSPVRVRKRASAKCLQVASSFAYFASVLARAGTCGLSLAFPYRASSHAALGLCKADPSCGDSLLAGRELDARCSAGLARQYRR